MRVRFAAGAGDVGHQLVRQLHRLVRIVGDAELKEHVRPAHDTQADLAGLLGGEIDLLERIAVGVDDIVQEMHRFFNRVPQFFPVDLRPSVPGCLPSWISTPNATSLTAAIPRRRSRSLSTISS